MRAGLVSSRRRKAVPDRGSVRRLSSQRIPPNTAAYTAARITQNRIPFRTVSPFQPRA